MFFERHRGGERAVLVQLQLGGAERDLSLLEFEELVASAGGEPVATITGSRSAPHARTFVGEGKLEEIAEACQTHSAELVIFNHALSPSQERNLERTLSCRVLARTGLILDIFAQRARTHEGKLQVELAQLTHMSTRLVRGWTHLERQKGGIGLRGPGETQLETDRRLLRARIKSIQARLERVRNQREQSRRARRRAELPVLSLVGYTNAGKSTLFNALTGADLGCTPFADPKTQRDNLAFGARVTTSAGASQPVFGPDRLTNGIPDRFDHFLGYPTQPKPLEITLELRAAVSVGRIVVHERAVGQSHEIYDLLVAADGSAWRRVGRAQQGSRGEDSFVVHRFAPRDVRYIRIVTQGCHGLTFPSFSRLCEVEAFAR